MAQIYFHYSSSDGVVVDRRGSDFDDLVEIRDQAARIVRALIATRGPEDWRDWMLHVSDRSGEEIFTMPFSLLLGRPH